MNREGVFESVSRDAMLMDEVPINAVNLGSRVDYGRSFDNFHSMRGDDEFQRDVQGVGLLWGTTYVLHWRGPALKWSSL